MSLPGNSRRGREAVERQLGLSLVPTYSSWDDHNPDEEFGHYTCYEAEPNPLESIADRVEPITIKLYDSGEVSLFHDATPYPLKAHSPRQGRSMMQTLCECPMPYANLTKEDWQALVNQLLAEYAD